ncbi:hypothetical protein OI69_17760 [Pectobacterium fontis]|uniref:Uncharacterized protein n=1 Tax=Pectobacterium fontis TaxID=2558042 RepID=A0A7V8IG69_9GAMM|nr:hypothetical protein OI69_17760 [Pectobacterium fontis]
MLVRIRVITWATMICKIYISLRYKFSIVIVSPFPTLKIITFPTLLHSQLSMRSINIRDRIPMFVSG